MNEPMIGSYGRERGDLRGAKFCGRVDLYDRHGRYMGVVWTGFTADGDARPLADDLARAHGGRLLERSPTGELQADASLQLLQLPGEAVPLPAEPNTEYHDGHGGVRRAYQIPWPTVQRILGHPHTGSAEDDMLLCAWLIECHAPAWVSRAEGWTDEGGWGLIEPETSRAARILGRKGGQARSPAKAAAARINGRLGGRPRKPQPIE